MSDDYEFQDVRAFVIKRKWLTQILLKAGEYDLLKERTLRFDKERAKYIRAFIDGYMEARG